MKRSAPTGSPGSTPPKRAKCSARKPRTPPSPPSLSLVLPQLGKPAKPTFKPYCTRSREDIYKDIHDAEDELECIAEEVRDEHGDYVLDEHGCSVWKQNDDTEEDNKDFKLYLGQLHVAEKQRDNLLDLIKHGYMQWVNCTEAEWLKMPLVSDYYYFCITGCEIIRMGCWKFTAPLSEEHQAHFDDLLHQYVFYGHPNYQDPRTEEMDTADLCFEDGCRSLDTACGMKRDSLRKIEYGDMSDIRARIRLYGEDADSCNTLKSLKDKLRAVIAKYHT